jgi:hypothetical protein
LERQSHHAAIIHMDGSLPYLRHPLIEQLARLLHASLSNRKVFCALHKMHIAMHNKQPYLRPVQGMLRLA